MSQRLWVDAERPQWAREQARRLDEGHFAQVSQHEEWLEEERERRWWQQWEDSWAWDSDQQCWTYADWSSGASAGSGTRWWTQEPIALSHDLPASSSTWPEDKDPETMTMADVHKDMGTHRLKAMTPLSFQPQRHIAMILGRPVMVHMW